MDDGAHGILFLVRDRVSFGEDHDDGYTSRRDDFLAQPFIEVLKTTQLEVNKVPYHVDPFSQLSLFLSALNPCTQLGVVFRVPEFAPLDRDDGRISCRIPPSSLCPNFVTDDRILFRVLHRPSKPKTS